MATNEEKAVALKNEGNKAFAAHDWPTAINFYTKAIELNDKEPTYWSNRAQVSAVLADPNVGESDRVPDNTPPRHRQTSSPRPTAMR